MSRRKRAIAITDDVLEYIPARHLSIILDSMPDGTRVTGAFSDFQLNANFLVIEHDSFDEVPEACALPMFKLEKDRQNIYVMEGL